MPDELINDSPEPGTPGYSPRASGVLGTEPRFAGIHCFQCRYANPGPGGHEHCREVQCRESIAGIAGANGNGAYARMAAKGEGCGRFKLRRQPAFETPKPE